MANVNIDRWREHVLTALETGVSFMDYAKVHGFSHHTLYAAQQKMKKQGELPQRYSRATRKAILSVPDSAVKKQPVKKMQQSLHSDPSSHSFFVPVVVQDPSPWDAAVPVLQKPARFAVNQRLRAKLPNGIELDWEACSGDELNRVLQQLAVLSCLG